MIDYGRPPLGRVDAFGNFWHGSYSISNSWRSRSGAVMPGFPPTPAVSAVANAKAAFDEHSAHLVDFGMPTQQTPTAEATAGMERWNKAVLHGANRAYAIGSDNGFGVTGWPYRSPDGTVWFLKMDRTTTGTQKVVNVRARKLDLNFTAPTTIVASINVPTTAGGDLVDNVNFSPDGKKAAGHSYNSSIGESNRWTNTVLMWVVEASVSGGDAGAWPTITLVLGGDPMGNPNDLIVYGPSLQVKWVTDTTYINVQPTTRTEVTTYHSPVLEQQLDDSGNGKTEAYSSSGYGNNLVMVAYSADNARHEIHVRIGDETTWSVPIIESSTTGVIYQNQILGAQGWGLLGSPTTQENVSCRCSQIEVKSDIAYLLRDGQKIAAIEATSRTVSVGWAYSTYGPPTHIVTDDSILSGPTKIGNGWVGDTSFLADTALRVRRESGNVVALITGSLYVQWKVLAWIGAIGSGLYGASTPLALPNSIFPAINPETGAFVLDTRLYF